LLMDLQLEFAFPKELIVDNCNSSAGGLGSHKRVGRDSCEVEFITTEPAV
jgi:hypothetical protein